MRWYNTGISYTDKPFIKKITIVRRSICLVGYEGQIYALSSRCPHAGEDLGRGWCSDGKLICPYHRFSYNLETGRGSPGQNDYVDSYPVKLDGNNIYIGIDSFWQKLKGMFK